MVKNIIIVVLIIIAIAEGYFLYQSHKTMKAQQLAAMTPTNRQSNLPPAGPNARGAGRPVIMTKGMNLKSSPLFKYTYQIAPTMPDSSKKALTGFTMTTQKQSDGSIIVSITPKDSDDQSQQYTVKSGNTLYFIEQTPVDDKADQDKDLNYRDDYGIITDASGVIQ